jgi:putative FmdB family regulatory protein
MGGVERRFHPAAKIEESSIVRESRRALPLYPYRCTTCGHRFEKIQSFSAEPEKVCPKCGNETLVRQLTAPRFQFKGAGWYINDYAPKSSEGSSEASSESKPAESKEAAKSSDATSGSSTASAPAAPAAAPSPTAAPAPKSTDKS